MCMLPKSRDTKRLTNAREQVIVYHLTALPRDFKRVLRVQMKEFIHHLDEIDSSKAFLPRLAFYRDKLVS